MSTYSLLSVCRNIAQQALIRNFFAVQCGPQRSLSTGQFQNLIVEKCGEKKNVAVIKLHRPKTFNALNDALMGELGVALQDLDQDKDIGCIIITGSGRAFAVGADVPEMSQKTLESVIEQDFPANYCVISKCKKPIIAAVNGYAFGGGCEVAMMCDIIYAADKAQFSQPEVTIGTIPGAGGTQRLIHAVGKSKAMEMVLSGNRVLADEAERMCLVSKVFPADELMDAAVKTAEKIASFSHINVALCKEAVNASQGTSLLQGRQMEFLLACGSAATGEAKEWISAFVEKRKLK